MHTVIGECTTAKTKHVTTPFLDQTKRRMQYEYLK